MSASKTVDRRLVESLIPESCDASLHYGVRSGLADGRCQASLKFDMAKLIDRAELPKDTAVHRCVLEERCQPPRQVPRQCEQRSGRGVPAPCGLDEREANGGDQEVGDPESNGGT